MNKILRKKRFGFTLVEMLTVIFIIVVLAGFITPGLGRAREKTRVSKCKHNMRQLAQLVALEEMDTGVWPTNIATLTASISTEEADEITVCPQALLDGIATPHYVINGKRIEHSTSVTGHDFYINENLSLIDP